VLVFFTLDKPFHQMPGKPLADALHLGPVCERAIDAERAINGKNIHCIASPDNLCVWIGKAWCFVSFREHFRSKRNFRRVAPSRRRERNPALRLVPQEEQKMSDDAPLTPEIESFDPKPEVKSRIADVSEAVKDTAHRIGDAIETGKKPGMPLSILSNIAREAPLGSLFVAFLLGVAIGRRR
jgi:hypothetical protein